MHGPKRGSSSVSSQANKKRLLQIEAGTFYNGVPINVKVNYQSASTQTPMANALLKQIVDAPNKLIVKRLTFHYGRRKPKPVKGVTDSIHLHFTHTGVDEAGSGDQLVNPGGTGGFEDKKTLIPRYLTKQQILGTSQPYNDDRPLLSRDISLAQEFFSLFKANQSAIQAPLNTGTDAYINDQTPPLEQYVVIKNLDETILLKNHGSFPCTVQIYWMICKNETSADPMVDFVGEMTANVRGQSAALVSESNTRSGYLTTPVFMPNYGPGNLKDWKNNWRLFHAESFVLDMNEQVKFIIHHNINRVLSQTNLTDNEGDYVPGLSICPIVFANGSLGTFSETVGGVTTTYCAPSPVNLCGMTSRHFEIGFLPKKVIAPPFQAFNLRHARGQTVNEIDEESNVNVAYIASN